MPGVGRPPSHTALAALPVVALDLETTGLDVANDRIVQIGAVPMRGPVLLHEPRIDTHVDPGVPISAVSIRIHGITDSEVAGASRFGDSPVRISEDWCATCVCSKTRSRCCVHRSPGSAAGRRDPDPAAPRATPYAIGMSGTHT